MAPREQLDGLELREKLHRRETKQIAANAAKQSQQTRLTVVAHALDLLEPGVHSADVPHGLAIIRRACSAVTW